MCSLFSAELESQSGSERVEARSAQTPEFRLFESACLPDYPNSDLFQAPLAEGMHRMEHHPKDGSEKCCYNRSRIIVLSFLAING